MTTDNTISTRSVIQFLDADDEEFPTILDDHTLTPDEYGQILCGFVAASEARNMANLVAKVSYELIKLGHTPGIVSPVYKDWEQQVTYHVQGHFGYGFTVAQEIAGQERVFILDI